MTVCAGLVKHHQIRNYFLDFCTAWVDIEDQGLPSSGWCGVRDRTVGQAPVYVCLCYFLGLTEGACDGKSCYDPPALPCGMYASTRV